MPGSAVGIARYGPPVGLPGLGSNVSSWLAPPASHSKITRLSPRFNSLASSGLRNTSSAVISAASAPAPSAAAPKNDRRERPEDGRVIGVSLSLWERAGVRVLRRLLIVESTFAAR